MLYEKSEKSEFRLQFSSRLVKIEFDAMRKISGGSL